MPFPATWPPRVPSGSRSIRFYVTGTATANFSDNAFIFADQAAANTYTPLPYVAPGSRATVNVPATPSGSGTNANDANPDPAVNASAVPAKMIWCRSFTIHNESGNAIEFSFDGTNTHGYVPGNSRVNYFDRFEAGIAVKGNGAFRIEAW